MDMTQVERYLELRRQKSELEAQMKSLGEHLGEVESAIIEAMTHNGLTMLKVNGQSVGLRRELWASLADETAIEALKASSLAGIVKETVNRQTLSSAVRELDLDDNGFPILPDGLAGKITVAEVYRLSLRNS